MYYDHAYGPHLWVHGLGSVLFFLAVIIVLVMVFRHFRSGRHKGWKADCHGRPEALTLLETRFVNGEIDRDEFFAKKRDLEASEPPPLPPGKGN